MQAGMPNPYRNTTLEITWRREHSRAHAPRHHLMRVLANGEQHPWWPGTPLSIIELDKITYQPMFGPHALHPATTLDAAKYALVDTLLDHVVQDAKVLSAQSAVLSGYLRRT